MNISLTNDQRINVLNSEALYKIMEQIIIREEGIDQDRKQCFVVSLGIGKEILNIELIALGSQLSVIVEPLEVFGQSIAKRANSIVLVLYHGNRELKLLQSEIELVNRIHSCGIILNVEMADCLLMNNESFMSLREDQSLYNELVTSNEFVPAHEIRGRAIEEGWNLGVRIVAGNMVELGLDLDTIVNSTQLDSAQLVQLTKKSKQK